MPSSALQFRAVTGIHQNRRHDNSTAQRPNGQGLNPDSSAVPNEISWVVQHINQVHNSPMPAAQPGAFRRGRNAPLLLMLLISQIRPADSPSTASMPERAITPSGYGGADHPEHDNHGLGTGLSPVVNALHKLASLYPGMTH